MTETSSPKVKIAPHTKESEMMVLGCMLTSVNSLNIGADALDDADFYFTEHKIIFQTLKSAYRSDRPADVHLISEELKRQDKLKAVGGISYLTTLAQYAGTSAYVEEYVELVRSKSILRRMITAAQEVEKNALNDPEDVQATLDDAQAKFFTISQTASSGAGMLLRDILSGVKSMSQLPFLKELQLRQEKFIQRGPEDLGITGVPTHFMDLDRMINGLGNSNLMILAARPAMGKTALALNIAENVAFKNDLPVGIFSLEMTAEQLIHRMICSQSEVESDKIKTGSLNGVEYQRVVAAVNSMMKGTIVIDDQPGLKITDLRARARRMKESYNISLLIVDYLQLISGSGLSRNAENRQNEISEISRMMKTLAREINLPIICLSQLSRKVEERQGHRPMMSDLRESGCLTGDSVIQDANTGKLYTIKELAERPEQTPIFVHAVDENLKIGRHRMVKAFYSGKKKTFKLTTRSGRSIKASANHPFLKFGEWIPLEKLQAGDKIGVPDKKLFSSSPNTHLDVISIKTVKEEFNLGWREVCAGLNTSYCGTALFKSGISRNRMQALYQILPSPQIYNAAHSEVIWDEIRSIEELGVEDVYDATVENVHNFVSNGIIVHNSIEQDSDIVMFLLRREYYDPFDKPGLAELIVAKNRHGAVGSVNLTYRKELAQFANYSPMHTSSSGTSNNDEAFAAFSPNG
ncbi:MAG: replicative DNA helicase [Parachlamydiales bacterium]